MSFLVILILEKLRESVPLFIFANQPVFVIYAWLGGSEGGGCCNFYKKNKLKSEAFNDKKSL